jgi:hypothetical protein
MAQNYSPKIVQDSLVMCLDASQNKSYPTTDLPVKAGLLLWLDAADDTTFNYSTGTEVSQWRDKSGNNFHANQATTAQQPSRSTVVNSRKSVNFTSANGDFMRVNSGMVFTNSVTAIVFIKPGTQNNAYADILDQDHSMDGYNGWVIQRNNTASQWLVWLANEANTTWLNTNAISYTDNTSQIVTLRKGSSTLTLYSNGTSSGDVAVANQQIRQANYFGLNIGYWRAGGGRYYNGEICEIVVYNRALSLTELNQVHTYLGQKWGVSNTDRSIIDLSGNNNNGLLGDGVTVDMPLFDVYNKGALKLDGSTEYVAVANATSLNPTTVTVSIWVKRNGYQSQTANYLRRNYNDAYGILGDANADNVRFRIHNGSTYPESPNATLSLNEWTNIVGTYDLANIKIYKNGVFVGQTAHTSAISYSSANTTLTIGRDDPIAGRYMNANYGSVLIYSRALSAAEVAQNYEAQKSKFADTIVQQGLVLNVDAGNPYSYAGAGTTWYDTSGAVNDFTLVNSPIFSANQFILNGSTQYFSINAASGFFISSTNNFYADVGYAWTICVWFKFPVSPTTVRNSTVNGGNCSYSMIGNAGGIGGAETLSLFVSGGDSSTSAGGLAPYFCVVGVRGSKTQLSTGSVNTNTWNHVIVTWNGSAGRGYFNGVDKGALNIGANGMQVSGYTIGATAGGASSHVFEGSLSQVFVYNRALSSTEALQNYNATKGQFGL